MRYKYYKRMIGQMRHKKLIAFFILVFLILILCLTYVRTDIIPTIKTICESKAQAIALTVTTETIEDYMDEFKYESLMDIKYSETGKVSTISANATQMNKLSAKIVNEVQEKIGKVNDITVKIPIGKVFGWSIFSGYGPNIGIKIVPTGNVDAEFKTEFCAQGINQTKHTIYIQINTYVTIVAPFTSDAIESISVLTVAETIIIGDIPETYYNIEGLENVSESGIADTF